MGNDKIDVYTKVTSENFYQLLGYQASASQQSRIDVVLRLIDDFNFFDCSNRLLIARIIRELIDSICDKNIRDLLIRACKGRLLDDHC